VKGPIYFLSSLKYSKDVADPRIVLDPANLRNTAISRPNNFHKITDPRLADYKNKTYPYFAACASVGRTQLQHVTKDLNAIIINCTEYHFERPSIYWLKINIVRQCFHFL